MSGKHLHHNVIVDLLLRAAKWRGKSFSSAKNIATAEDMDRLGRAVSRLADERNEVRISQQRMHKKYRESQDDLAAARRQIARLEKEKLGFAKMLSDQEFDHNRRSNKQIARHAGQIVALKGDGSFPDHITRFEVIGNGRELVRNGVEVELSLQDDNRTLKVFLK